MKLSERIRIFVSGRHLEFADLYLGWAWDAERLERKAHAADALSAEQILLILGRSLPRFAEEFEAVDAGREYARRLKGQDDERETE